MSPHLPPVRGAPSLRTRALKKTFGPLTVIDDLSLDVAAGRITALLGPNGAGKTTLLKCILGLVQPEEGSVLIDGEPADRKGRYRGDIGFMPQLPTFPVHMNGHEMAALLDRLRGFTGTPDEELVDAFGLRADMEKPFRVLSGGTRQKVNAALAFRYPVPILILDEPTAGLDPVASLALKDKIQRCRDEGRTVVITSHKLAELQDLADDVAFLHEGRLRFMGSVDELLAETRCSSLEQAIAALMLGNGPGQADNRESGRRVSPESPADPPRPLRALR